MSEPVEINAVIGTRLRQHRTARGWTLDELATRSGVSRRQLITIEHGEGNPSIATLLRLSDALGIGLPALVDVDRPTTTRITPAGEAPVLWQGPAGGRASLVASTEPPDMVELWEWILHPGERHRSDAHRTGTRELLLVTEGHVHLEVGDDRHPLGAGDAASFDGDLPHSYVAPSEATTPAQFTLAVYEPPAASEP